MSESWPCVGHGHRWAGESPVPPETITPEALVDDLFVVMDVLEARGVCRGRDILLQAELEAAARMLESACDFCRFPSILEG